MSRFNLFRKISKSNIYCFTRRVAELEQENARLLAITRGEADPALTEMEQLRAQLAAAEQRSNELSAQLALQSESEMPSGVKMESFEPSLPASEPPSSRASPVPQSGHKSGASLGLMVCTFSVLVTVASFRGEDQTICSLLRGLPT